MPHGPVRRRHPGKVVARPTHAGFRPLVLGGETVPSESAGALGRRTGGIDYGDARDGEQVQTGDIGPGAVDGGVNIKPASIVRSLFASTIVPPEVVTSLPALPNASYPQGVLVFLTSDQKLYRNLDGNTWSVAVDGADITAHTITAGSIAAGAIGATELAAELVLASVIKTADAGARVEIDVNGVRSYNASEEVEVQIPTDGSAVYVKGQIQATELLVTGNAYLRGTGNELSAGSVTTLGAALSAPSQAPALSQSWDTFTIASPVFAWQGLSYDSAGGAGGATKVFWSLDQDAFGAWKVRELKASDGLVNRSMSSDLATELAGHGVDTTGLNAYGIARHSSYIYVLVSTNPAPTFATSWGAARYNASDLTFSSFFGGLSMPYSASASQNPQICSDGTNPYIVDKGSGTGTIKWNKYNDSMVKQGSTIDTTYSSGSGHTVIGAAAGNFDFGAFRIAAMISESGTVETFDSTGARQANEQFPTKTVGTGYGGLTYGDAVADGARFWSHGGASPLTKHSTWTWTTASAKYWVGYTWHDSNATGGTHETTVGPRASITMGRRKKLLVTMAALPGSGGTDDPDNHRIYMFPNATAPATTSLKLQTGTPDLTKTLRTYDSGGAAPPVANDFPAATAAELKSGSAEWSLKGDGTAEFTTLLIDSTADVTATSTPNPLQIGLTSGDNVVFDNNEIMARSNGVVATLYLQKDGGTVETGGPIVSAGQNDFTNGSAALTLSGGGYIHWTERTDPAAPAANDARLYVRDNGAGKTQLVIRFSSGAIQVIATQP